MIYKHSDTGEYWTEEEVREVYEQFKGESEYMNGFYTFEEYMQDQLISGTLVKEEKEC